MTALLNELRHDPWLWLLVFVPAVFVGHDLWFEAHTLLFGLSVLGSSRWRRRSAARPSRWQQAVDVVVTSRHSH